METLWMFRRGTRMHGPMGLEELRAAYALGFLQPGDPVVRLDQPDPWAPAAQWQELIAGEGCRSEVKSVRVAES